MGVCDFTFNRRPEDPFLCQVKKEIEVLFDEKITGKGRLDRIKEAATDREVLEELVRVLKEYATNSPLGGGNTETNQGSTGS